MVEGKVAGKEDVEVNIGDDAVSIIEAVKGFLDKADRSTHSQCKQDCTKCNANPTFFFCGQAGHISRNCPRKAQNGLVYLGTSVGNWNPKKCNNACWSGLGTIYIGTANDCVLFPTRATKQSRFQAVNR